MTDIHATVERIKAAPYVPIIWGEPTMPGDRTKDVIRACAKMAGSTIDELAGPRRERGVVNARHAAMWIIYKRMGRLSLPQIGRIFGGRDHSSVIHARNKVQADLDSGGKVFGPIIAHVERELGVA